MTEYINNTNNNTNKTLSKNIGQRNANELPNEHRTRIALVCFEAFRNTCSREEFSELIELIKPLCLWQSKTPTLDAAYFDGFTTALSILKQEEA